MCLIKHFGDSISFTIVSCFAYCIAGIFHGGKYSFFASSAPFYNRGCHTHLLNFCSLDSFLNEEIKVKHYMVTFFIVSEFLQANKVGLHELVMQVSKQVLTEVSRA